MGRGCVWVVKVGRRDATSFKKWEVAIVAKLYCGKKWGMK